MRILFAASEAYPLIKTGGLGDVAGALPRALVNAGEDLRLVLPAYGDIKANLGKVKTLLQTTINGLPVSLLQTTLPGTRVTVWLVDCPPLFDRPGNPYTDAAGHDWSDNAQRFMLFCQAIAALANDDWGLGWQPQVVHLNDWQTGLVPVLLQRQRSRPATVFTIHNLAYRGLYDYATFSALGLDPALWHYQYLEFFDHFAFIKGGLIFADRITTVSPNYAREIQTEAFGEGLEGLLAQRSAVVSGILNGIDTRDWNPGSDPHLTEHYNRKQLERKRLNKRALQLELDLPEDDAPMLAGLVSRLVEQKGIDLILDTLPQLMAYNIQLVILGTGDPILEARLQQAAIDFTGRLVLRLGYNEALAHRIEAGCDVFLMPSRFEPCGLNQMYSQHYGTLPIVTPVGGLYDTVVDANAKNLQDKTASGFVMREVGGEALVEALGRARECYTEPQTWRQLQRTAMARDFSWGQSAQAYRDLYADAWARRR